MFSRDSFARHCDRFVTLCNQVIVPPMEEALRAWEARGWVGSIRLFKGQTGSRRRAAIEPEITLTLRPLDAEMICAFVRCSGNYTRNAVEISLGRVGEPAPAEYLPMAEVTEALVEAAIARAAACAHSSEAGALAG